jgi:hypothetical protein
MASVAVPRHGCLGLLEQAKEAGDEPQHKKRRLDSAIVLRTSFIYPPKLPRERERESEPLHLGSRALTWLEFTSFTDLNPGERAAIQHVNRCADPRFVEAVSSDLAGCV